MFLSAESELERHLSIARFEAVASLVATVLDIRMRRALPTITVGVIIAGILVSVVTYGGVAVFS